MRLNCIKFRTEVSEHYSIEYVFLSSKCARFYPPRFYKAKLERYPPHMFLTDKQTDTDPFVVL